MDTLPCETLIGALTDAARAAGLDIDKVCGLRRLSGGASKESWAFDLVDKREQVVPLVLRRQPNDLRFSLAVVDSLSIEAALLRAAGAAGVPVPDVCFELPGDSPAGEGYAMGRIEGETVGSRILKDPRFARARATMAQQCGAILARIHAIDTATLPELKNLSPREELDALKARFRATGQCRPVFEYALLWLANNIPADDRRTLVHGDFRNGNFVVDATGIRAVLDWELAHLGSPVSDLGWLCVTSWRFQNPQLAVGGFGTRAQLIEGYAEAGGAPVDPDELHFWEVFQTLFWGVMCAEVGKTFLDGVRSVEGAMIARRASETEFDLLRLLCPRDGGWHAG